MPNILPNPNGRHPFEATHQMPLPGLDIKIASEALNKSNIAKHPVGDSVRNLQNTVIAAYFRACADLTLPVEIPRKEIQNPPPSHTRYIIGENRISECFDSTPVALVHTLVAQNEDWIRLIEVPHSFFKQKGVPVGEFDSLIMMQTGHENEGGEIQFFYYDKNNKRCCAIGTEIPIETSLAEKLGTPLNTSIDTAEPQGSALDMLLENSFPRHNTPPKHPFVGALDIFSQKGLLNPANTEDFINYLAALNRVLLIEREAQKPQKVEFLCLDDMFDAERKVLVHSASNDDIRVGVQYFFPSLNEGDYLEISEIIIPRMLVDNPKVSERFYYQDRVFIVRTKKGNKIDLHIFEQWSNWSEPCEVFPNEMSHGGSLLSLLASQGMMVERNNFSLPEKGKFVLDAVFTPRLEVSALTVF